MNGERLLQHYERIADAHDAIARLRRFVLDLAVRGKLVPQDANDEPASELLKRIAKERLDQSGLPQGWRRARIGSILDFQYGKGLKASERLDEGPVPVFGSNGIVGFTDEPLTARPSIIVGRKGSAGALNLCNGPSWTTDVAYFVEAPAFLDLRFMLNALAALDLDKLGKGVKPGLSRSEAYGEIIALPPLAEQHRIVAKVDELMGLCDRLEAARAGREATRDRLAAASLARLNAPDPEKFQADARFALDALPALTTRPDQIKRLRQTILNLAVRGKLVPQDANDEPAAELLKRIGREKARLVKAGEARKSEIDPVNEDDAPFLVPSNWRWTRLGSIGDWGSGSTPPRGNLEFYGGGIAWLKSGELNDNRSLAGSEETVSQLAIEKGSFRLNKPGDLLLAMYGATIGKVAILAESAVTNQAVCGCTPFAGVFNQFLFLFLLSQREHFHSASEGGAQPNISKVKIVWTPFPLPPLAEQHRIVAKVDELMALCDRLEASLDRTAATRRRLLGAILHEALNGQSRVLKSEAA